MNLMLSVLLPTGMRLSLKKNNRLLKVKPGLSLGLTFYPYKNFPWVLGENGVV